MKKAPSEIHSEGVASGFTNGVPDRYIEGTANSLWVEFKWVQRPPVRKDFIIPNLSALQMNWLLRAHHNNRPVAVIVGTPKYSLISVHPYEWEHGIPLSAAVEHIAEVGEWIGSVVLGGIYDPSVRASDLLLFGRSG